MMRFGFSGGFLLTALALVSCGDPVPPPAEGTASISIGTPTAPDAGWNCTSIPIHTTVIGKAAPDTASQGETSIDGKDGADIECSVTGEGTYSFSGKLKQGTSIFTVSGQASAGGTSTGSASLYDLQTTFPIASDPAQPCTFTTHQVEAGAIWASFTCPKVVNPNQIGLWCGARGTFVFKSCSD
jgi:hypothetical protein